MKTPPDATDTALPAAGNVGIVGAVQRGDPDTFWVEPPAIEHPVVQETVEFDVTFPVKPVPPRTLTGPLMVTAPLAAMSAYILIESGLVGMLVTVLREQSEDTVPAPDTPMTTATIVRLGPLTGSEPVEMTRRYSGCADEAHGGVQLLADVVSTQFTMIVAVPSVVEPLVMVRVSPVYVLAVASCSLPIP